MTTFRRAVRADEEPIRPVDWTKVLLSFIAMLMVVAQGFVIYLTNGIRVEVAETRAIQERNGTILKKQEDRYRERENYHRSMQGLPPLREE